MLGFKDKITIVLYGIIYTLVLFQIYLIFSISDKEDPDSYIIYHKIYFYIMTFMSLWCQIRLSIIDPGIITLKNNQAVTEFYLNLHELGIKRAEKFNESYGDVFFKNVNQEGDLLNDEEESEPSDLDESTYEPVTSITDEVVTKISNEYKINLKRCQQCYVVRPPRCHHCSLCKGCVMKMDHHCPWVNNCIGQFTQKFFILYCIYSLINCIECLNIIFYYLIYKNRDDLKKSKWGYFILLCVVLFFCFVFLIFSACMIHNEWNTIQNDTTMIDMKKKKFLEKRDLNEVINETFGCGFNLSWFFPIKIGGYLPFFNKLLKGRRRS